MAKLKLSELKKYLSEMTEVELREELLKLFQKLTQVQEFYAQELMSEQDRKVILVDYKKKIYNHFYTGSGNPRFSINNAEIRKLISAFEKVSVFPHEFVDLLLYRVEVATAFASQFGGMPDSDYNAAFNAFEKAMKMAKTHKLEDFVRIRCQELFKADNLDFWFIDWLEQSFNEHVGK